MQIKGTYAITSQLSRDILYVKHKQKGAKSGKIHNHI